MMRDIGFHDDLGRFGDAPALFAEDGRVIGYRELEESIARLKLHLQPRCLAFILAENGEESIAGYVAMLQARVPAALLAASLNPALLADLLSLYRPRYLWLPRDRGGAISGAREVHGYGRYVLLDTGAPDCPIHPDLALLTTTSGSTGSPKLVRQTYRNLDTNTCAIAEYLGIQPGDRAITALPMNYVFGLSVINSHLARGASLVLTDRGLMEKEFWALLKGMEATSLSGVPYTFQMLRQLRFNRMTLPHIKTLTQAGGKLGAELAREFAITCRDKGIKFFIMYGAAEATARMSYLPPEHAVEKPDSIGIAIPGGTFEITDEQGFPVTKLDVTRELLYLCHNVAMCYASSREDLARRVDNGGLLRTGDIARRGADGFHYIVGRKSRFIKIFGNRVNLEDVEQHLRTLGVDSACAGEDDKMRVFVTSEADNERAAVAVSELTGLHHSAFTFVTIGEIPRNAAGKIIYAALP